MLGIYFILFCVFAFVQLLFIWVVFGRLAFGKLPAWPAGKHCPPVSVVVAARNEYANLQKLLPLLLEQHYPDFEIVVVDDRSDDESFEWLMQMAEQHPRLKRVRVEDVPDHVNPKKYAITLGIKAAKHEHVLFTDADCIPGEYWIANMVAPYSAEGTSLVLGVSRYEKDDSFLNRFIRYETLYVACLYLSRALQGSPYMGVGRNLSYTKTIFFKNKGFTRHKDITGGDDDLFINEVATGKNTQIAWVLESQTLSIPKRNWGDWYRQKTRHLGVGVHYRFRDKLWLGLLGASHGGFYALLFFLLALGVFPWALLGIYFFRLVSQWIVFSQARKKIDPTFEWAMWPIFDFMHFFYLFVSLAAATTKRTTWN